MKTSVVLLAADDAQAEMVAAILPHILLLRCRDVAEARQVCRTRPIALVLLVDDPPDRDGCRVFADINAAQPGVAGVLLSSSPRPERLRDALEAGLSGLVALPCTPAHLSRVVEQALERFRLQQENTRLRTLIPLYNLGEQFLGARTEQEILDGLVEAVDRQTGASHISVMLYDAQQGNLHIAASRGMDPALVRSIRLQPGDQIAGWVFQQGKAVILNREDQHSSIFSSLLRQPELVSAISFPLRNRERIIGVLNISQKASDERFSHADTEMLSILCSQAAGAIDNLRARSQLAETTRTRTLFEQYVAPEVAELLLARDTDLMELGEITEVTVLFADIRNFTRLVQHVDLGVLRQFLNAFFQFFTEEVFQWQGTVDKFMGDAVLAVFGAPVRLERPNLAAARAAWTIGRRFQALRDQWQQRCAAFASVDLGIAVTSGTIFLGNIGSAQRLDYTVIGPEVNIAQRLAAESSSCQIYITDAVRGAIADWFIVTDLGQMRLRGVDRDPQVFALQGERHGV
jgi:adenylate cyclase